LFGFRIIAHFQSAKGLEISEITYMWCIFLEAGWISSVGFIPAPERPGNDIPTSPPSTPKNSGLIGQHFALQTAGIVILGPGAARSIKAPVDQQMGEYPKMAMWYPDQIGKQVINQLI